eukprot:2444781-Amphidinium_carterae.1
MKPRPARLQASHARVMRTGTRAEQAQFAFAAVIWDNESDEASLEGYIMDAVVLGRSLQEHAPKADRIMLATRSALMSPASPLLSLYWQVREVEHVEVAEQLVSHPDMRPRFRKCFTKLRVFELEEYQK